MISLVRSTIIKTLTLPRIANVIATNLSAGISGIVHRPMMKGHPYVLTIEPTNRCNLHCPQCITGAGKLKRPTGLMEWDTFKNCIDQLEDSVCYVVLYNQGEPFLHPEFIRMVKYAKSRRMYVVTSSNGHFLKPDIIPELASSGLDVLTVSLDGADEVTYRQYRQGGNFNTVINGIRLLTQQPRPRPAIYLQYLVMRHNESGIEKIKSLANELKVDNLLLKTVQVESIADAATFLPKAARWRRYQTDTTKLELRHKTDRLCSRLWTGVTVLWDGSVVPCCFDKQGSYIMGNINEQSLHKIWHSELYENFRLRTLKSRSSIDICSNCTQGQTVFL